ncbi:MAG: peptidoglycan DD-metalloendopeptidase family protein [Patescibacteria group bacterium]
MKSFKHILVDLFIVCAKFFVVIKRIAVALIGGIFKLCYITLKLLLKWPVFFAYKAFVHFRYRMGLSGIHIKNPFLYVCSSKTVLSLILAGAGILVTFFNITLDTTEASNLAPDNLLVYYVFPTDESAIEDSAPSLSSAGEYVPLSGLRVPSTPLPQPPSTSFTPPGGIALNSGALIKPTLPSSQEGAQSINALRTYTIQPGDTASSIAARFNLSLNSILWANNLNATSRLTVGQKLTILPVDGVLHRVKRGDTIGRIATLYNADMDQVLAFNNLPPNGAISVDDALIIPNGIMKTVLPSGRRNTTLIGRLQNILKPPSVKAIPERIGRVLRFLWPTSASRITQYFSWRHSGVDIAGPPSNKIYAAAQGVVIISGWQSGYGRTVLIDHGNGYRTRYGHASKLFVSAGERVERGDVIAMVGSTGRSTGPHLHFEILRNGSRVNPLIHIR